MSHCSRFSISTEADPLTFVFSSVSLGLRESDSRSPDLSVYCIELEEAFLTATQTYYTAESAKFIAENSVTDYMKKVEARLKEESDRVEVYLHPSTDEKLLKRCDQVLIEGQKSLLHDCFLGLLENEQSDGEWTFSACQSGESH